MKVNCAWCKQENDREDCVVTQYSKCWWEEKVDVLICDSCASNDDRVRNSDDPHGKEWE